MEKKPLIVLTGPTAVGKTALSVELARRIGGEIISADSMQVYRHMNIGSAKITKEQMGDIPHHLIDILDPWEEFNVVIFQRKCMECLEQIYERGKVPILAGGTGFYIQAVLNDIDFTANEENCGYREHLEELLRKEGPGKLHELLMEVDPGSARVIHPNNSKRCIRALEYHFQTGGRIFEHNEQERQKESAYQSCYFVLNDIRERLYTRIEERVDEMLSQGLVEEVKSLQSMGCRRGMVSMQGLGYKEILAYLEEEITLEEAVRLIKRDTRHFAKRQLTWFGREKEVIWVNKDQFSYDDVAILDYLITCIKGKGILDVMPAQ